MPRPLKLKKYFFAKFLCYVEKICAQRFNDILRGVRVTFFSSTPKMSIPQTSSLLHKFVSFSCAYSCNDSFKIKLVIFR